VDPVLVPLVEAAALRGEKVVSTSRAVLCALVLLRFLLIGGATTSAYALNGGALGIAIATSVAILVRLRRGKVDLALLTASVVVDAIACTASLLQTVLWPSSGERYRGILLTPDIGALLLVVYCAGYRVWPRLARLGAALNVVAFCLLVAADRRFQESRLGYGWAEIVFFLMVLCAVVVLSVGTSSRTIALLTRGAAAATQVERARGKLVELVRDQHDARSALSSATLSSSLLLKSLGEAGPASELQRRVERLTADLVAARDRLAQIGERAFVELCALDEIVPVDTARAVEDALRAGALRYPELEIDNATREAPALLVAGGARSIQRILFNLVTNASEGDGRRGARRVRVESREVDGRVELAVEDDGPGLPGLDGGALVAASTKADGLGLGLVMAAELTRISGGDLEIENRAEGGARVRMRFLLADSTEPHEARDAPKLARRERVS
jgi:signal transduction histidine kinase